MKVLQGGIAAALVATAASGSMVAFESGPGLEGLGSFTGSMEWVYPVDGSDCGQLAVRLVNTSPEANGGFITGFAFNAPSGVTIAFLSEGDRWLEVSSVDADPFGVFSIGAALDGDFLGGGSPVDGVGVGGEQKFLFEVCADAEILAGLAAGDFFDESSGYAFVARFKGFNDEGSDKVPAATPSPGAVALFLLAGMTARRRR